MKRAFIFPGQGSQIVGMCREFYQSESIAQEMFRISDEISGHNLSEIIFNGPQEDLSITTNAQIALMTSAIVIFKLLQLKSNKSINELCDVVAGHSLGEYSALCAAGALTFEDTVGLLKIRSNAMQNAVPIGEGGMVACIGISKSRLQNIMNDLVHDGICEIANDNVEGQIVISGHQYNVDTISEFLNSNGYRAIKLKVSAPFHSSLMVDAVIAMEPAIKNTHFSQLKVPIISNISARLIDDTNQVQQDLLDQICGTVRWRETMDELANLGVSELVEIGPGKVLTNLAQKSPHKFVTYNISNAEDLAQYICCS